MTYKNVEVIKAPVAQVKKTWFQRHCPTFAAAGAAVGTMVIASSANAAGVADLFTEISTEMGGVSDGVLSILTILAGVVALLLGWAYVKRAK
ncbi:hypothetical protein ACIRA0001_0176 [Acinetobacter radioresistens SK82]|uniref:Bacteriophage coat protein B n=1 Tax=Acinetobacter radioresistens SK82 TaxID=596318 RepID=A0ABM9YJT8_ACIRA|nr:MULTISPECIES: hypothetical protein [Acinetobacter]EET81153.1 hypothetical protein ACIRA0001_0176 [Acinetobacter radioresistens SK82]EXC27344.1 hypothetical protein J520_2845 [Acinetobacter sp. 869535]QMU05327.1 hypothetical protein FOC39_15295 [Acinetobacter radioresistens]QMU05334.1 hypothetical protein FOC39_15345 [Acinetobacter radioresistens]QMU05344.1 hypothetical protein FOC39_00055 [Acinetobacter radioresistens]